MIKDGKAYVDNTPTDVMRQERETKTPSKCREKCKYLCNNLRNSSICLIFLCVFYTLKFFAAVQDNLNLWAEMKAGSATGLECCLRAKIDYASDNGCMRDPVLYRCKLEPHPRTGTKHK